MQRNITYDYVLRSVKDRSFIMIDITDAACGPLLDNKTINKVIDFICQKELLNPVEHYVIFKPKYQGYFKHDYATGLSENTGESHWLKAAIKCLNM